MCWKLNTKIVFSPGFFNLSKNFNANIKETKKYQLYVKVYNCLWSHNLYNRQKHENNLLRNVKKFHSKPSIFMSDADYVLISASSLTNEPLVCSLQRGHNLPRLPSGLENDRDMGRTNLTINTT